MEPRAYIEAAFGAIAFIVMVGRIDGLNLLPLIRTRDHRLRRLLPVGASYIGMALASAWHVLNPLFLQTTATWPGIVMLVSIVVYILSTNTRWRQAPPDDWQ